MRRRALHVFLSLCLILSSLLAIEIIIAPSASAALTCARGGVCIVGDTGPGGGKVFNVSGTSYLEAAQSDLADMAYETAMGVAVNSTYNGKTGWRLPTLDESKLMNQQRTLLNFTSNSYYWTSSETTISQAYIIAMTYTSWYPFEKTSPFPSRPIRSFSALTCANGGTCAIGDTGPGGGKVFVSGGSFTCGANLELSCSALEYATAWTDTQVAWSGNLTDLIGRDLNQLGGGLGNSESMVAQSGGGSTPLRAATIARAFRGGGKSDWYLPSYWEAVNLSYLRATLTGFQSGTYWTSSEAFANSANYLNIMTGLSSYTSKGSLYWVRPIRAFLEVGILTSRTLLINSGSLKSSYSMAETPPTLTSTASAGAGSKSYSSSTSGICSVDSSSGLVTFAALGTCTITAAIDADSTYAAVTSTSRSFTIAKGIPEVSLSIVGGSAQLMYRTSAQISVLSNVAGRFTLQANSKAVPGCINVSITSSRNCFLKPSVRGILALTVNFMPSNTINYFSRSSQVFNIPVARRTTLR